MDVHPNQKLEIQKNTLKKQSATKIITQIIFGMNIPKYRFGAKMT